MKGPDVLTASDSPLVVGASAQVMKTIHIKVTRPFLIGGKRQEIGAVLEVSNVLAGELISANKAVKTEPKVELKAETPRVEKAKEQKA